MEVFVSAPSFSFSNVEFPAGSAVRDVLSRFIHTQGVSSEEFYVVTNGRLSDLEDPLQPGAVYHLEPRLRGGKGGFGSMLRALGAQIEKTTNREACRDLSGRRLRDVNHEKEMAEWLKKQAEREAEKEQRRLDRLQRKLAEPKHMFTDPEYQRQCHDLSERLEDSVIKGLQVSSSGQVRADDVSAAKKRASPDQSEQPQKKKKKKSKAAGAAACFWTGVGELLSSEDDEDDEDEEETPSTSSSSCGAAAVTMTTPTEEAEPGQSSSSSSCRPSETTSDQTSRPSETTSDQTSSSSETTSDQTSSSSETTSDQTSRPSETASEPTPDPSEDQEPAVCRPSQQQTTAPQAAVSPLNLSSLSSVSELEALGLDILKGELMSRGLKCGGTLTERAARLFSVRGLTPDQIDPALLAKPSKAKRK
nr:replication stress response regulator SDE2 [Labrus bergylta]